ncbi:MAG: LytTR family transcriptional regulator [Clostridia bacterium]|nr:LytTR family transcriptional regulator [Clostridia bacterium]
MKFSLFIDRNREEEVIVYAHERNELVESVEQLVSEETQLTGYSGKTAVRLYLNDVYCFTVESNKVYAVTETEKFEMKQRLYQLEKIADKAFVKINQSCIANIGKIDRFDASVSGTMRVNFKNGYTDYVSRRQLKSVKERLGLLL